MPYRTIFLIILSHTVLNYAQRADNIVLGSSIQATCSENISYFRLAGRMHIPGSFFDIEASPVSVAVMLDSELIEQYGVSWVSLPGFTAALLSTKAPVLRGVSNALMAIHALLNANVSVGSCWIRACGGWKNDFYIFNDVLWLFEPAVGGKLAFPGKNFFSGAVQAGVAFPASIGGDRDLLGDIRRFQPKLYVGLDAFFGWADIRLGPK